MLIWAELWHSKKAGIATSHGDRKRRTRNENWGQIGIWSRPRCSVQFRSQNHIWIMKWLVIHLSALFVTDSMKFEVPVCRLSIFRESVIVVNKTCPGSSARKFWYKVRTLVFASKETIIRQKWNRPRWKKAKICIIRCVELHFKKSNVFPLSPGCPSKNWFSFAFFSQNAKMQPLWTIGQ